MCVEYRCQVRRIWDLTECVPGCCPNSYLIDCGDNEFLVIETSERSLNKCGDLFPGDSVSVRVLAAVGDVVSASVTGHPTAFARPSLRDAYPGLSGTEVRACRISELPNEVQRLIDGPDNNKMQQTSHG